MEIFDIVSKCEISNRFRLILFCSVVLLVCFHVFVVVAPIIVPTMETLNFYRAIANDISNLSVALILLYIVVQLQADIYTNIRVRRSRSYEKVAAEISDWFMAVKSPLFDDEVVASTPCEKQQALQNFSVCGAAEKVMAVYGYGSELRPMIDQYCRQVHFELTNYPTEMIYGIHFELGIRSLNEKLCNFLLDHFGFRQQMKAFAIDEEIPKRPPWAFLTRTVELDADTEAGFAQNLTHARHFVELVGHGYEFLYSRGMIDLYLAETAE